jgi:hypothetical protein
LFFYHQAPKQQKAALAALAAFAAAVLIQVAPAEAVEVKTTVCRSNPTAKVGLLLSRRIDSCAEDVVICFEIMLLNALSLCIDADLPQEQRKAVRDLGWDRHPRSNSQKGETENFNKGKNLTV